MRGNEHVAVKNLKLLYEFKIKIKDIVRNLPWKDQEQKQMSYHEKKPDYTHKLLIIKTLIIMMWTK